MKLLQKFAVTCAAFLLTGCIGIDITQVIHADGTATVNLVYNMKEFFEITVAMTDTEQTMTEEEYAANMAEAEEGFSTVCEDDEWQSDAGLPVEITNITCEYLGDFRFKVSGTMDLKQSDSFKMIEQNDGSLLYRVYIKDLGDQFNKAGESDTADTMALDTDTTEEIQDMFTITYSIEMPGEITRADVGIIKGTRVEINLVQQQLAENHVIESIIEKGVVQHVQLQYGSPTDKRKERICLRVKRYSADAKMLERINRRLGKRFGFMCTTLDF